MRVMHCQFEGLTFTPSRAQLLTRRSCLSQAGARHHETHLLAFESSVCIAVGTVVFAPLLGGPKAATATRMRLMHFATLTGVLLAAVWMIAQYCLQVQRFCNSVGRQGQLVCKGVKPAANIGAHIASPALLPYPRSIFMKSAASYQMLLHWCRTAPRRV